MKLSQDFEDIYNKAQESIEPWLKQEYFLAIQSWGKLFKQNPEAFNSYKPLVNLIRDKQRESIDQGSFEKDLIELAENYQAGKLEPETAHLAFSKLFFTLGLLPQHWFEFEELKASLKLWKIEANKQPFFPYNGYILGIIYCYCGIYGEANTILQRAYDHIPSSKRKALKIEEIISLIRKVVGEPKKKSNTGKDNFSEHDWLSLGFEQGEQLESWRVSGLSPEIARLWKEQKFSAKEATRWFKGEFELDDAIVWREKFSDDPVFATQCRVAGFEDPAVAASWMKIFTFPSEAMRWIEQGFSSRDAAVWMRQGVTDPAEAKKRKMH